VVCWLLPARPAYFHRLTEALETFRQLHTDWIDRRTVEETLGVSKTVAWRVLRSCGASAGPGNTVVCRRLELIQALEALQQTGQYEHEIRRRSRVEQNLNLLLQSARSRHIQVAPDNRGVGLVNTRFATLPVGITLSPSRLTIDFTGTPDFLEKVGALVFALQNDYEAVGEFIEKGPI
jgi:hypothetical protein